LNGILRPGEELPSVRSVAVQLAIKPGIVERVYRELEGEGILSSEEGSGVFVANSIQGCADCPAAPFATLEGFCLEWIERVASHGFSVEHIVEELTILKRRQP
jgi:GntR family transcriptional regulator